MKKLIAGLMALIFILVFSFPATADKRKKGPKRDQGRYEQQERDSHHGGYKQDHRRNGYRYKYYGHRRHHKHRGHYRGHWRSWRQWEDHRSYRQRDYRDGRYYRKEGQLYFEFENEDGRFVFSIGR